MERDGLDRLVERRLPDGVRLIRRRDRRQRAAPSAPARVITMAWGDRYIDDLIEITIPALLAPGNLPVFAAAFESEFVIVTEIRLFDRLLRSPSVLALLEHVDLRLAPIDDLLSPWYGITLTYALVRGFADLGAAMTRTHLVFLNADFIIADGSLAKLAEVIATGARLVVSPSYCMNLEATIDDLRRRRDPINGILQLSKRELAGIIIANRHNTIRAKTVNQRLFRIHRYDQFYWYVDDRTLLGRQMPIAVVYMRPERVLTEMPTFWDYGVISEYCPTAAPCVLGDSDDFLMAELRGQATFRDLLHLGWPSVDEIAVDLSSFTTRDHRDYGRHTLVLHAGDLPAGAESGAAALARFVDAVYARLKPPLDYRDHPFWAPQFPRFFAGQQQRLGELRAAEAAAARLVAEDPRAAWRERRIAALAARIRVLDGDLRAVWRGAGDRRKAAAARLVLLEQQFAAQRGALERDMGSLTAGEETAAAQLRAEAAKAERRLAALRRQQERALARRGAVTGGRDQAHCSIPAPPDMAATRGRGRRLRAALSRRAVAWSARAYRRGFGALPQTTRLHPFHTMLRPVLGALGEVAGAAEVLVVSSGGTLAAPVAQTLAGNKLAVTPALLDSEAWRSAFGQGRRFELCFCDLVADDLGKFRRMLEAMRPLLAATARIVLTHHNVAGRAIDERTYEFTEGLFPLFGRSRIAFAGSYPGALAVRWFARALARHNAAQPRGIVALSAALAVCAPLALLGAWFEARRPAERLPGRCTSMVVVIDLP